ncbi:MAG: hypothetical protein ACKE5M_05850 [Methylophilaceae bacterium]
MQANQYDVYAQFLLECKEVMGSVDFERLDTDSEYRTEVCQRVMSKADDRLFDIADMVNREIESEEPTH